METKFEFVFNAKRKQNQYIEYHKHSCYELVYYLNGTGSTKINCDTYSYSPNTFAIVEPNCLHDENREAETDVIYIGFLFNGTGISINNGIYTDGFNYPILFYLNKIKQEVSEQKKFFNMKLDLALKELLIDFERIKSNIEDKVTDISSIKNFIEENCYKEINIAMLADMSGYSYHRFRHLFKEKTGVSPMNYIINCRINAAKNLLSQSNMSMLEISHACGYCNEPQFSSMFKSRTGVSPSYYRNQLLIEKNNNGNY